MNYQTHMQSSHAHTQLPPRPRLVLGTQSFLSVNLFPSSLFSSQLITRIFIPHIHSTNIMLMDSLKTCLISLGTISRKLNFLNKFSSWKRRKSKKFVVSDFSWLTASFPAMEVSNQLKQVFKMIDTDGDGKISPLELSEVLLSLGHEKTLATKEAEGMVREMDCDGDGLVDLDEFMSVVGSSENKIGTSAATEDDLAEAFLVFDTDKNGFISAKELQKVLISLGCQKCSLRDCRRMIKGVDKDGDGFVDFEEFKSMMNSGHGA